MADLTGTENSPTPQSNELSVSLLVEIGSFLKQAEQLLTREIGWEPQRQLANLWQPRLARVQQQLAQLSLLEEPTLVVAIVGGVKAGKTHIANKILGRQLLAESLRHETNRAWVVLPPQVAESDVLELLTPIENEWLRWLRYGIKIGNRNLILIDAPDFDSESLVSEFVENRKIVEAVVHAADVVLLVSSQAHNLTRYTFDWLRQFRQGHGFIFVYNEVSGAEGKEAALRIEQLQQQVIKAGFGEHTHVIGCPYLPGNYEGSALVKLLAELPSSRNLRSWRITESVRQLTQDIQAIYQEHQAAIQSVKKDLARYVANPLKEQLMTEIKSQIEAARHTFQRELLFRVAPRIGGPFGSFISIRRVLSYWSLPGLWLGARLMGQTGAILATTSVVFGSLFRSFEAWRDRRRLKSKTLLPKFKKQGTAIDKTHENLKLAFEHAQLDPIPVRTAKQRGRDQQELNRQLVHTIEAAFDHELNVGESKKSRARRIQSWRWLWNFLPSLIILYALGIVIWSLITQLPIIPAHWYHLKSSPDISFYLGIAAVLVGVLYTQYLILMLLLKHAGQRVSKRVLEQITTLQHPILLEVAKRLNAPGHLNEQAAQLAAQIEKIQPRLRKQLKGVELARRED
ncbi:hypothetical protein L0128_00430 [candidate division KSB1 bacterium]|nr:hypothetical protein [candidate division KSB1 bacterium]